METMTHGSATLAETAKPICSSQKWKDQLFVCLAVLLVAFPAWADIGWQPTAGPASGNVTALAIDPADHQTLYAGTSESGIFKSSDGGRSWSNSMMGGYIESIAIDPSNSKNVYSIVAGGDLYKSGDGGGSWTNISNGNYFRAVEVTSNGVVYGLEAYSAGFAKSIDSGKSWILSGGLASEMYSLAVDPTDNQVIYACGYTYYRKYGAVVFKSTNGGSTWNQMNSFVAKGGCQGIAVDPASTKTVYAITWDQLFKSTDAGGSWTEVDTGLENYTYLNSLLVDPLGSHAVYVGTVDGLLKSTDGGSTWIRDSGLSGSNVLSLAVDPVDRSMYAGTSGEGILKVGSGDTWTAVNKGLAGAVYSVATDPSRDGTIFAGTSTGLYSSGNGGDSWSRLFGYSASIIDISTDPGGQTLYASAAYLEDRWYGYFSGLYKSTNGGKEWTLLPLFAGAYAPGPVWSVAVDPKNSQTIYAGGHPELESHMGAVMKSTDGGATWSFNWTDSNVRKVVIDPGDSQTVWVGSDIGYDYDGEPLSTPTLQKSTDGGNTWQYYILEAPNGIPPAVRAIALEPGNSRTVYAGTGSGVYRTADGGATWAKVAGFNVVSLAIDRNDHSVYAATESGVYRSSDGGGTWKEQNIFLRDPNVNALAFNASGSTPYAGTSSLGVFKGSESAISGNPPASIEAGKPYSFTPTAAGATAFRISNKPRWASFDTATGALTGTPARSDAGTYRDIVISALIGTGEAALPPFSITVTVPLLTLTGYPPRSALATTPYSFTPTSTGAAGFSISKKPTWASFDPRTGTLSGTPSFADVGIYSDILISAFDGSSKVSLAPFTITVTLAMDFLSSDIGKVGVRGSASSVDDVFTVKGSGADIWGTADSFRYVYKTLWRDAEIVARVASLQNTNTHAKSGVMFRMGLSPNSAQAMMVITPSGAEFSRRVSTGGTTAVTTVASIRAPYWVKLVQAGGMVSGYVARDGINWVLVGSDRIPAAATSSAVNLYYGLAVTSHNNAVLCSSTLDSVSIQEGPNYIRSQITSPASGASFNSSADIDIYATAIPAPFADITSVTFAADGGDLGDAKAFPYRFTWRNPSRGHHLLTATARDSAGNYATSDPVEITVTNAALPTPWVTRDVGTVTRSGSATFLDGVFTLSGSGSDIWGAADGFRYVYRPFSGDGEIVARVTSLESTNGFAKGGIMMRGVLAGNSPHAMVDLTPSGVEFSRRTTTGGTTAVKATTGIPAPSWLKLVRKGKTFSGYFASDGVNWMRLGTATIDMEDPIYVGLIVNSHNRSALCTATMDNVAVLPPPWSTRDIGSVSSPGSAGYFNGSFTLTAAGADIWGTADAFRFVYKPLDGDGEIVARVASLQNSSAYAKAGVMIRRTLDPESMHAMIDVTPGKGAEFSRRSSTGGATRVTTLANVAAPRWVKLTRSGKTITGSVSTDGKNWSQVGSAIMEMTGTVYIGLVTTSHSTTSATATFDSIR